MGLQRRRHGPVGIAVSHIVRQDDLVDGKGVADLGEAADVVLVEMSEDHQIQFFDLKLVQRLDDIMPMELNGLCEELGQDRSFFNSVLDAIGRNVQPNAQSVELSGAANIFAYPEYSDLDKAKKFLSAIEGKDTLYRMLQRAAPLEFTITIGGENEQPELKGCSIVTATYKMGNDPLGSFGIIGPTRMPYARVLSIMEYISMSLSEALLGILDDE